MPRWPSAHYPVQVRTSGPVGESQRRRHDRYVLYSTVLISILTICQDVLGIVKEATDVTRFTTKQGNEVSALGPVNAAKFNDAPAADKA